MADEMDAADELQRLMQGGAATPTELAPLPSGGGDAADRMLSYIGRPEWEDERYTPASRAADFLRVHARAGRSYEDVAPEFERRFGADRARAEPVFKLEAARGRAATMEALNVSISMTPDTAMP